MMRDCPCIAEDLTAIFATYWDLTLVDNVFSAKDLRIADQPRVFYNREHPLLIEQDGVETQVYLAVSTHCLILVSIGWLYRRRRKN